MDKNMPVSPWFGPFPSVRQESLLLFSAKKGENSCGSIAWPIYPVRCKKP